MNDRPIPKPQNGVTPTEFTRVRSVMTSRYREQQPMINQPAQDTIPGEGSGDQ